MEWQRLDKTSSCDLIALVSTSQAASAASTSGFQRKESIVSAECMEFDGRIINIDVSDTQLLANKRWKERETGIHTEEIALKKLDISCSFKRLHRND